MIAMNATGGDSMWNLTLSDFLLIIGAIIGVPIILGGIYAIVVYFIYKP